jgi:murein DD-endopeptidase MepM/ murein hydrolase activator NlpD
MQEVSGENFLIDFVMESASLEEFLVKMDGINAINRSNNTLVNDLSYLKEELEKEKQALEQEKEALEEHQEHQNQMMTDFKNQEATLMEQLATETRRTAQLNANLENLNVDGIRASSGFIFPVRSGWVTATAWFYPASFGGGWHPGIDIGAPIGTPIIAPANGVVLATGSQGGGYGTWMLTAHQMGNHTYVFLYGHLNGFANFGATINQGQTIAFMGNTGFSTGPHLHLEVFRHSNTNLNSVINTFRNNRDMWFGLGYTGTGSCARVCRLNPGEMFNLRMGQRIH